MKADVFVIFDDGQFTKGSYINRTPVKYKGVEGVQWLTVPVNYKFGQAINEVELSQWDKTKIRLLSTIKMNYPGSEEVLSPILSKDFRTIAELNIELISAVVSKLEITTEIILSSNLRYNRGRNTNLLDIVKLLGGDMYLTGIGSLKYLDSDQFKDEGIDVEFYNYGVVYSNESVLKYLAK